MIGRNQMDDQPLRLAEDQNSSRAELTEAGRRSRYEGSTLHELTEGLRALDFFNRVILFGAALLLSVLPMIILLGALASSRVDDNIVEHLGLNAQGARIIEGLFRSPSVSFNLGVFVSLLVSFAGTLAVARSVQEIYERAFGQSRSRSPWNILRFLPWVLCLAALFVVDAAIGRPLRDGPGGPVVLGVVDFAALALFFWWSIHFLLAGRIAWRRSLAAALITALFWIGLALFASFYLSSTVISNSQLYGAVGVVFTLATWFIAMGAVIALGAVVGVVWETRHGRRA